MRKAFWIVNELKLKELMLQVGVKKIHTLKDVINYPCGVMLVGNEQEKYFWA